MITLYYFPECPFCKKVLDFIEGNGIEIELKNVREAVNLQELVEKTEKVKVPYIENSEDNTKMHESDDIIEYLSNLK